MNPYPELVDEVLVTDEAVLVGVGDVEELLWRRVVLLQERHDDVDGVHLGRLERHDVIDGLEVRVGRLYLTESLDEVVVHRDALATHGEDESVMLVQGQYVYFRRVLFCLGDGDITE